MWDWPRFRLECREKSYWSSKKDAGRTREGCGKVMYCLLECIGRNKQTTYRQWTCNMQLLSNQTPLTSSATFIFGHVDAWTRLTRTRPSPKFQFSSSTTVRYTYVSMSQCGFMFRHARVMICWPADWIQRWKQLLSEWRCRRRRVPHRVTGEC